RRRTLPRPGRAGARRFALRPPARGVRRDAGARGRADRAGRGRRGDRRITRRAGRDAAPRRRTRRLQPRGRAPRVRDRPRPRRPHPRRRLDLSRIPGGPPMTSPKSLPDRARIVIVGGGAGGTSVAYHLAGLGERDVVLVERADLTSGSTFHSAGL